MSNSSMAQNNELPYREIPEYSEIYNTENVIIRMIDGLGYRYYWATEGLSEQDLKFKPGEDGRTTEETLEHIFELSTMILNASEKNPNIRPQDVKKQTFSELRKNTLLSLEKASNLLKENKIEDLKVDFKRGDNVTSFPYWNMINGPISDAIYHVGQVVTFRRSAGNPMNSKVNVFMGKTSN